MPKLVHETIVARPAEDVFALVTDFDRVSKTLPGIKESKVLTPGPVTVGTRVRESREVKGRTRTVEFVVTAHDRGRKFWMDVYEQDKKMGNGGFDLESEGPATRLRYTLDFTLPWYFALLTPMIKRTAQEEMVGDLLAIKKAAEGVSLGSS